MILMRKNMDHIFRKHSVSMTDSYDENYNKIT